MIFISRIKKIEIAERKILVQQKNLTMSFLDNQAIYQMFGKKYNEHCRLMEKQAEEERLRLEQAEKELDQSCSYLRTFFENELQSLIEAKIQRKEMRREYNVHIYDYDILEMCDKPYFNKVLVFGQNLLSAQSDCAVSYELIYRGKVRRNDIDGSLDHALDIVVRINQEF